MLGNWCIVRFKDEESSNFNLVLTLQYLPSHIINNVSYKAISPSCMRNHLME